MATDCGVFTISYTVLVFIFLCATILIFWLVLRPHDPQFSIRDASVKVFNISTNPSCVNASIQVSIFSRNPNKRAGIYYENLKFYATYHSQQISLLNHIPYNSYQGSKDVTIWSPYISGELIVIEPYILQKLKQEESAGLMILKVVVEGKILWKIWAWKFGRYHLFVKCSTFMNTSTSTAYTFQSKQNTRCRVDV